MYHCKVRLSFKCLVMVLIAAPVLAISVSIRSTSADSPKPSALVRADAKRRAVLAASANRRRAFRDLMDLMNPDGLLPELEAAARSRCKPEILAQQKVNPDPDNLMTIPHWSSSFTYQGLKYNYTIVGTDPELGSATTIIPTVIIPLRTVVTDGHVFNASSDLVDGQTAVEGSSTPLSSSPTISLSAG
jgi:hypothetical protein